MMPADPWPHVNGKKQIKFTNILEIELIVRIPIPLSTKVYFPSAYQPASGNDISFTGTHYEKRENGQVVEIGDYEIVADPTVVESTCLNIEAGKYTQLINFKNARYIQKIFFDIRQKPHAAIRLLCFRWRQPPGV